MKAILIAILVMFSLTVVSANEEIKDPIEKVEVVLKQGEINSMETSIVLTTVEKMAVKVAIMDYYYQGRLMHSYLMTGHPDPCYPMVSCSDTVLVWCCSPPDDRGGPGDQ